MHQLKLGDFQIGRIAELEFPAFPAGEFLPAATGEIIAEVPVQVRAHDVGDLLGLDP